MGIQYFLPRAKIIIRVKRGKLHQDVGARDRERVLAERGPVPRAKQGGAGYGRQERDHGGCELIYCSYYIKICFLAPSTLLYPTSTIIINLNLLRTSKTNVQSQVELDVKVTRAFSDAVKQYHRALQYVNAIEESQDQFEQPRQELTSIASDYFKRQRYLKS